MDFRASMIAAVMLAALLARASGQTLPAFPGAEGFGSIAVGGRGGDVYYVTNLNASGAGSFAEGIATAPTGGRTILFKVSGHIRLPSGSGGGLTIAKSKITVAGQTAPGDGICFWNNTMNITGNDLVFRNIRWRYGKQTAGGDAVDISASERIIFDHCDVMFSTDENMSSFGTAPEHLTFQWSTNAWGLQSHSCGGLWKVKHATVHHTLWANNHTRNPKLIGCDVFDWVNNVTFGWDIGLNMSQEVTGGLGYIYRLNVRGSSFVHGGSTSSAIFGGGTNDDGSNKFRLHMADSALDGNNNGILDVSLTNFGIVASGTTYDAIPAAWPQTTDGNAANPIIGVPVTVAPRLTAYKKVMSKTGAVRMEIGSRPLRDEITQFCVTRAASLQRGIIADPLQLGLSTGTAFASLKSTAAPADTDADGLPDYWEDALGTSPAVANHNTVFTAGQLPNTFFPSGSPVGYTHLEEYLHFKAVPHGTVGKNTVASPSFIDIDLRKYTSGFTSLPTFTVANITGGTITQSGPGNAIVRFTPTLDTAGRGGFLFTVTDAAGDSWTQQCCLLVSTQPLPRPITWVGDGVTNNWDTTTANFTSNVGPTAFANTDAVTINDTGSNDPTIKLQGTLLPASVTVSNSSKNFTLTGGGSMASSGAFSKSGSGTLTISNTGPNSFSSASFDGGTLALNTANALGTAPISFIAGTLTLSADQSNALVIDGNVAINPSGSRNMNGAWSGAGTLNLTNTGSNLLTLGGSMAAFSGMVNLGNSTGNIRLNGNTGSTSTHFDLGSSTVTLHTRNGATTVHLGSLSGGSGTRLAGASSVAGNTTFSIGAMNESSVFNGGIHNGSLGATAPTAVTKTGTGVLTLTGTSTHSGATNINSGMLSLSGSFGASPVTVAANATLAGTGTLGGSLTTVSGAILSPGADNGASSGTLTAASLDLVSPTLRFDLSNNPASGNDRIHSTGPVSLGGTIHFVFNLTNGVVGPGTYDLITTPGPVTATGVTLTSNLPTGSRQTLLLEHHAAGVRLVVSGTNANLAWTGANGGIWDQQTTAAWSSGGSPDTFFNFDTVTFNDTASNGNVIIARPVAPQSITVNNTAARAYTITGAPITGTTSLVKSGSGALTMNVPRHDLIDCTLTAGSPTVTVSSTTGIVPGMSVISRDSPAVIPAGTTVVSVINATTVALSQNASVTGTTARLIFETRNTFSGGTILNAGSLTLASNSWEYYSSSFPPPSNPYGLGTGPITLNGGTLTLLGHSVSTLHVSGPLPNDLIVPAGKTATLRSVMRGTYLNDIAGLRGTLTGSGTLNLVVNFAYGSIVGDWSAFSGTLNVSRATSGAIDPRFQLGHPLGLPGATVNLDQVTLSYTAIPPPEGVVVPIGSLSGVGTTIMAGAETGVAPVTWQVGALDSSTTFGGNFTPYGNAPIGLEKTGSGTWTLTGTGTVSAGITVAQGTLSYGDAPADTLSGTSEIVVDPSATLQLNQGAKIIGSSCEIFNEGTLRGLGTLQAPLNSFGTIAIIGGTFNIIGDANLSGTLEFSALTDRLAVTGDLSLEGTIKLPATGLSSGRKLLASYTGSFTPGNLVVTTASTSFFAVPDTSIPGEIAVLIIDNTAWQAWQTEKFSSTTSPESQPDADPDNDGMINLEEFQAGTNPNDILSFVALVWQGITGVNPWDQATTASWLENATPRVFRNKRHVLINDTGSNSPAIDLRDPAQPGSLTVSNSTKAFTISGAGSINGTTGLTKSGTGTLTITTSNNFAGVTAIDAGILNIQRASALGSADGATTVANNARLELQNNITVIGEPLTLSGQGGASFFNGALNAKSGVNTWAGPIMLAASGTRIGAQAGATLVVAGSITSDPANTGLVVRPADMTATVQLSGANSYAGETAIVGGLLKLGAADTLPVATTLRFGLSNVSGKLDLNGFDQRISGFTPISGTANEILSASGGTLTVDLAVNASLPVPVNGTAALTKAGPATLTVSSMHGFTGPTTVAGGRLLLDLSPLASPVNPIPPASALVMAGGILEIKGKPAAASSQVFAAPTLTPETSSTIVLTPNGSTTTTLTLGDAWTLGENATLLLDLSAGNCAVFSNPVLTGWLLPGVSIKDSSGLTGPATVVAGQIVRYIAPTLTTATDDVTREYSSLASVYSGGTLDWTNGGLLANRSVNRLVLDTTQNGGTIHLGAATNVLTLASGEILFSGPNDLTLSGGQLGPDNSAVSITTDGPQALTVSSLITGGSGSLAVHGTGNLILNSANTFTGGLTLNGGTLRQGVAGALGSSNGTVTLSSGTLDLNGIATGFGTLNGSGGVITSATAATLTLENNNVTGGNFAGSMTGSLALIKRGTGTQTLSNANTHSGNTTVLGGTLITGADNALGQGSLLVRGGTVDLQSYSSQVAAVQLVSGSITGSTGVLSASSVELVTGTLSARIGGAATSVAKTSSPYTNTVTLSGQNSYGGATTLGANSGSLVLDHDSALGATSGVDVAGNGTAIVLANGRTIQGKAITIRGNGTNNGSNAGSFSGSLTTAVNASATWTGPITLGDSNGRLGAGNNGTLQVTGPIFGSTGNQNLSLSSVGGTVVVATTEGQSTFTGKVNVVRGQLKLGAQNTLPTSVVVDVGSAPIADTVSFDLNGYSQELAGLTRTSNNGTQSSTVTNSSASPATLTLNQSTGPLSYSGRITGNLTVRKTGAGSFTLPRADALASSVSLMLDAGTLAVSSPQTVNALRINGVWQSAGTYTSANSGGRIASGTIEVNTDGPGGFTGWITGFPGLSGGQLLPTADPDHDGIQNLLEYVLGGEPDESDPQVLPTVGFSPSHIVFSFQRREDSITGTTQIFQYGNALDGWTDVRITAPIGPEVGLGAIVNGFRPVTIAIPRSQAPDGKLFGRLRVSEP